MSFVLSQYPLSLPFRERFEARFGPQERYILMTELRRMPLPSMLAALRSMRPPSLTVAYEDPSSVALVPVLQAIAGITKARTLQVVDGNLHAAPFGRSRSVAAALDILRESIGAATDRRWCARRLAELGSLERVRVPVRLNGVVAYLNCNLWFGVKAGGSVGHISGVANALMDAGYDLEFHTVGGRLLVDERADLRTLEPPASLAMPFEATYYRYHRKLTRLIGHSFERRRPTLIYQRLSLGNFTGAELSRRFGIPLIMEYNGSEAWVAKNWGSPLRYHELAVKAERVALCHAHIVVTVSEPLKQELVEIGVPADRIVCYPNCIDPKMFDPLRYPASDRSAVRRALQLEDADTLVTFVGTFGQWHGAERLAAAARKLVVEHRALVDRTRLRFLFVGDGLKMPEVRRELDFVDSQSYVRLPGLVPQRDAPRYLAASDVVVSPHVPNSDGSAFFGSPTKLFEYMAMGKAIVASELDQIGAVLSPGIRVNELRPDAAPAVGAACALLTTPGSVDELARAIAFAAENPAIGAAIGANARATALSRYTWRHHVDAILARLVALAEAQGGI